MGELVRIMEGQPRTTSLLISEAFGKQHAHVLRAIANIVKVLPEHLSNFGEMFHSIAGGQGAKRKMRYYTVDETGFMLLVMGFTGDVAMKVKSAFIAEFIRMKDLLRNSNTVGALRREASKLMQHPNFCSPEERDCLSMSLQLVRRVERVKGANAAWELYKELGLPVPASVRAQEAAQALTHQPTPSAPTTRAKVWEFARECQIEVSVTHEVGKLELWECYNRWASGKGLTPFEPPRFNQQIQSQFGIEGKHGVWPLRVGIANEYDVGAA